MSDETQRTLAEVVARAAERQRELDEALAKARAATQRAIDAQHRYWTDLLAGVGDDPMTGDWARLDESPAASAQMIQWYAPETFRVIAEHLDDLRIQLAAAETKLRAATSALAACREVREKRAGGL